MILLDHVKENKEVAFGDSFKLKSQIMLGIAGGILLCCIITPIILCLRKKNMKKTDFSDVKNDSVRDIENENIKGAHYLKEATYGGSKAKVDAEVA